MGYLLSIRTLVRIPACLLLLLSLSVVQAAEYDPYRFGIYTARLDGSGFKRIIAHSTKQMTHARVSPNGKWITFTRYNWKGPDGLAQEKNGYVQTSIMIARIDGTGVQTVVPPRRGVIAANSSWTPDGRGLIYVSTDNPRRKPQIYHIDLKTRRISRIPTPPKLFVSDPHQVGNLLVFPAIGNQAQGLWLMYVNGSRPKRLTNPQFRPTRSWSRFRRGDYDPRFSPDGTKIAFMRHFGGETWHVIIVDTKTGRQRDLSRGQTTDGLPDWTSDGKRLIFWHVDRRRPRQIGLYTMKPDGGDRRMIPLPRGMMYFHVSSFPGEGSGNRARIIFVGTRNPKIP